MLLEKNELYNCLVQFCKQQGFEMKEAEKSDHSASGVSYFALKTREICFPSLNEVLNSETYRLHEVCHEIMHGVGVILNETEKNYAVEEFVTELATLKFIKDNLLLNPEDDVIYSIKVLAYLNVYSENIANFDDKLLKKLKAKSEMRFEYLKENI